MEIYNEKFVDLLCPDNKVQIRENLSRVYLEGAGESPIENLEDLNRIMGTGFANRTVAQTQMNDRSSRSHSIFILYLEKLKEEQGIRNLMKCQFNFVDLAGSERQKISKTSEGALKEGCNINKSLSFLSAVINQLSQNSRRKQFIRYRDSKLTFLLRDSLGGNSKTVMIANVAEDKNQIQETISTLLFSQMTKLIKNKVQINVDQDGCPRRLKEEVKRLTLQLDEANQKIKFMEKDLVQGNRNQSCTKNGPGVVFDEYFKHTPLKNLLEEKQISELERLLQNCIQNYELTLDLLENEIKSKEKMSTQLYNKKKIDF